MRITKEGKETCAECLKEFKKTFPNKRKLKVRLKLELLLIDKEAKRLREELKRVKYELFETAYYKNQVKKLLRG